MSRDRQSGGYDADFDPSRRKWKPVGVNTTPLTQQQHFRYDSVDALLALPIHPTNVGNTSAFLFKKDGVPKDHFMGDPETWYGAKNSYDYADKVRTGDPKMASALKDTRVELGDLPKIASIQRKRVWAEDGEDFDIERVYCGAYDKPWQKFQMNLKAGSARNVRLVVNTVASADNAGPALRWRGAAACVLADVLEDAGYQVEIVMCEYVRNLKIGEYNNTHYLFEVPVKKYGEPVNLAHLAATVATQSALRVAMFHANLASVPDCNEGLGNCVNEVPPEPLMAPSDIWVDAIFCKKDAVECLQYTIDKFVRGPKKED